MFLALDLGSGRLEIDEGLLGTQEGTVAILEQLLAGARVGRLWVEKVLEAVEPKVDPADPRKGRPPVGFTCVALVCVGTYDDER